MATQIEVPRTLQEAITYFADPNRALAFMVAIRWPNGIVCQECGSKEAKFLSTRNLWECPNKHARRQFSVKKGTVMEDSPISLSKWLPAMWLVCNCKNGISSYELHRALDVTQKTAWFMNHRIRLAMQRGTFDMLTGTVEADETYIGGKARNMHKGSSRKAKQQRGRSLAGKVVVAGLLQRKGKRGHSIARVRVVPNVNQNTLSGGIRENVDLGSNIYTDELPSYYNLNPEYVHEVVNHAEQYVRGNVHTNGMENFWSLLKRAIRGTYVSVEPFHLFRYLDEQMFRFNERKHPQGDGGRFVEVVKTLMGKRLMYKELIALNPAVSAT